MSIMTKYLKQKCQYEALVLNEDGEPRLDQYGIPEFEAAVSVRCRRERSEKEVETTDGRIVRSTTVYYIDESITLHSGDKIDGKSVLQIAEYTGSLGKCEGWLAYV